METTVETRAETNYYVVQARCGHVGRGKYIPLDFPIRASDAERAAFIARQRPGVKHHHPEAILSVRKINFVEFLLYREINRRDPYWKWTTYDYDALLFRIKYEDYYHRIKKPSIGRGLSKRAGKRAARDFRIKKSHIIERSVSRDIINEYGLSV
jgi:hypothetical protein